MNALIPVTSIRPLFWNLSPSSLVSPITPLESLSMPTAYTAWIVWISGAVCPKVFNNGIDALEFVNPYKKFIMWVATKDGSTELILKVDRV